MSIFTGVISIVLLVFAIAVPANAGAQTFPGTNGIIAFSKLSSGQTNIWVVNAEGTHQRRLTSQGGSNPVWSPDGRKLVFVDNKGQLQMIRTDGRPNEVLTGANGYIDSSPTWSADSTKLAFVRQEKTPEKRSAVFSVDIHSRAVQSISGWSQVFRYSAPSWSPDGTHIVFQRTSSHSSSLVIKNLATNSLKQLTVLSDIVETETSWSPNGKKILFTDSPGQIYTIWPDGTHRTVISDGDSYQASWSPDGSKIVFLEDLTGDSLSISEPDGTISWIPIQKHSYQSLANPVWSPDGTQLLFTMNHQDHTGDTFSLHLGSREQIHILSGLVGLPSWQAAPNKR